MKFGSFARQLNQVKKNSAQPKHRKKGLSFNLRVKKAPQADKIKPDDGDPKLRISTANATDIFNNREESSMAALIEAKRTYEQLKSQVV